MKRRGLTFKPRRRRSRTLTILVWMLTLPVLACGAMACLPDLGWIPALAANLCAQLVIAGLLVLPVALLSRRWLATAALIISIVTAGWWILYPRLVTARTPTADAPTVRLLQYNCLAYNDDLEGIIAVLRDHPADVVSLVEPTTDLLAFLRNSEDFQAMYPHRYIPATARAGYPVVLSVWPKRGGNGFTQGPRETLSGRRRTMIVDRPEGPFALVQVMPESPRNPSRSATGEATWDRVLRDVETRLIDLDLPTILLGDVNGTPSGGRQREAARRFDLRPAKPLTALDGTWPAHLPWPLRVAIDDALVGPSISVRSWRTLDPGGSDHLPVFIELAVPATP